MGVVRYKKTSASYCAIALFDFVLGSVFLASIFDFRLPILDKGDLYECYKRV
jgi:hypothetical protein